MSSFYENLNQNTPSASNTTFENIIVDGNITVTGTVDGVDLSNLNTDSIANAVSIVGDQSINGSKTFLQQLTLNTGFNSLANSSLTGNLSVTGNISVSGTVDGVDIDALNTTVSGKANIASPTFTGTVSGITSAMVGLGNVDNTSDANKPVSTAAQTALNAKADDNAVVKLAGNQTITGNLILDDNVILKVGTGEDLNIHHDGSASYISEDGTGDLRIHGQLVKIGYKDPTSGTITEQVNVGSTGVHFYQGITLNDSKKIKLGTGDDLEIYHDGSNSYIKDVGTGNLVIEAADLSLSDSHEFRRVYCTDGASGAVQLYYGDTSATGSKLNTTNTGVNITGTLNADALTGSQTTVVNSTLQTATNFFGKRMIHTGGAVTYSFAAVGSDDVGKSVTVINTGTASITLSITTSKFYDLTAGVAPDYSGSGSSSHTLLKGGVAEFIVTEANKMIILGSGII
tara:strand:- start:1808 stop:3178 length:1371 start_codon:yes stop_codon:yes gene_type:complete